MQAEGGGQLSAEGRDDEEDNRSDLYQPTERGDDDGEDLLLHLAELGDAADEFPGDGGGMHEEFEEDLVRLGQKTPSSQAQKKYGNTTSVMFLIGHGAPTAREVKVDLCSVR